MISGPLFRSQTLFKNLNILNMKIYCHWYVILTMTIQSQLKKCLYVLLNQTNYQSFA